MHKDIQKQIDKWPVIVDELDVEHIELDFNSCPVDYDTSTWETDDVSTCKRNILIELERMK